MNHLNIIARITIIIICVLLLGCMLTDSVSDLTMFIKLLTIPLLLITIYQLIARL